jgi:HAD superfamily hydrolase (TIGR01509 family)
VAAGLVDLLRGRAASLAERLTGERDPLEVLRQVGATGDRAATVAVEQALITAEIRAVESAEPTPHGREVIVAARKLGWPVAMVSNNSGEAVSAYLYRHRLSSLVGVVVGRPYADPARMKPDPAPILDAAVQLGVDSARCVLVGDSRTDIAGAHAAGARAIGYANRASKVEVFREAGADVVVTSMAELARVLVRQSGEEQSDVTGLPE